MLYLRAASASSATVPQDGLQAVENLRQVAVIPAATTHQYVYRYMQSQLWFLQWQPFSVPKCSR